MKLSASRTHAIAFLMSVVMIGAVLAAPLAQAQTSVTEQTTEPAPASRGTNLSFGGVKVSADLPLQIVSDELQMDQNINTAVFAGNVEVEQGDMKLNAAQVLVEYGMPEGASKPNQIIRITASGDVLMTSPTETAESKEAVYTIATREIVMTGGVVVTQGLNKVSGERMVVNLEDGTAVMRGRVRTIIEPKKSEPTSPEPAKDASQ